MLSRLWSDLCFQPRHSFYNPALKLMAEGYSIQTNILCETLGRIAMMLDNYALEVLSTELRCLS